MLGIHGEPFSDQRKLHFQLVFVPFCEDSSSGKHTAVLFVVKSLSEMDVELGKTSAIIFPKGHLSSTRWPICFSPACSWQGTDIKAARAQRFGALDIGEAWARRAKKTPLI